MPFWSPWEPTRLAWEDGGSREVARGHSGLGLQASVLLERRTATSCLSPVARMFRDGVARGADVESLWRRDQGTRCEAVSGHGGCGGRGHLPWWWVGGYLDPFSCTLTLSMSHLLWGKPKGPLTPLSGIKQLPMHETNAAARWEPEGFSPK